MIFQIQTYLEEYFSQRQFRDIDQYAVNLARLYDRERHHRKAKEFLLLMKRMRTAFYRRNQQASRAMFEKRLLGMLDSKFKKKDCWESQIVSPKNLKLQVNI